MNALFQIILIALVVGAVVWFAVAPDTATSPEIKEEITTENQVETATSTNLKVTPTTTASNSTNNDTSQEKSTAPPTTLTNSPLSLAPQTPTTPRGTFTSTLADLDTLFNETYDDSSLDISFEDTLDQSYGF